MNDISQYLKVRSQIRPGDVIVFAGNALISRAIDVFGGSKITHCGIVRQGVHGTSEVLLSESTIENGKSGAQTNPLGARLADYGDGAKAWWLPLSDEVHKLIDWEGFYKAVGAADGIVKYDIPGLFGFLARSVPVIGPRICQTENQRQMVCSGYVCHVFEGCGVLRGVNYNKITPQDVVEMSLYRQCVQLIGKPGNITRFNTV